MSSAPWCWEAWWRLARSPRRRACPPTLDRALSPRRSEPARSLSGSDRAWSRKTPTVEKAARSWMPCRSPGAPRASPAPHGHPTAGGWRSVPGTLWVADTYGGAPRQLTADLGWSPWAWSPTEDQLAVVDGRDVTLVDTATGSETDLGTVVGARTARATRFMPWCGRPTDPGSRTEGDQVGARSTRSMWRPASTHCSCVSPRERGRSKTSTGRPMVHTSRSPTATRRATWRRLVFTSRSGAEGRRCGASASTAPTRLRHRGDGGGEWLSR